MIIHVIGTPDTAQVTSLMALASEGDFELKYVVADSEDTLLPQLWETDVLLLINWNTQLSKADTRLIRWVELQKLCGRSMFICEVGQVPTQEQFTVLSLKPRTNYQPVDCGYYDHFEVAIVKRQAQRIRLTCFGESEERGAIQELGLLGTKTWRKEEFVEVEGYGWMRADWVKMVDVSIDGSCSV